MMKKYKRVEKLTDNRFLNLYHIDALDRNSKGFDYYFASRNDEAHIKIHTKEMKPEGIVIYALTDEADPRLVLIRQYRYPLDAYLYELPAGLVDAGETPAQAACREMKEETGLDFTEYTGGNACYRRPFFMGPGFTDETSAAVFGTVSGEISDCGNEATEEIQVLLADKATVRRILETERVSLRGAYLMMQFLDSEGACPKTKFDAVSTTRYREESSKIIQHGVCRNGKAGVFGRPGGGALRLSGAVIFAPRLSKVSPCETCSLFSWFILCICCASVIKNARICILSDKNTVTHHIFTT